MSSLVRHLLQALLYAAMSAAVILGIAYLLTLSAQEARDRAYEEIHAHRLAFVCWQAILTPALSELLIEHGLPPLEPVQINGGIDCDELTLPEATPEAGVP